jgi:hypothetical protein
MGSRIAGDEKRPLPIAGLVDAAKAREIVLRNVERTESCWIWTGSLHHAGYGQVMVKYRNLRAHRLSYYAWKGDTDRILDHLCRNPRCVNPEHLEAVTYQENTLRGIGPSSVNAKKTECRRGHSLAGAPISKNGERRCRQCERITCAAYQARNRELVRKRKREYMRAVRAKARLHTPSAA